MSLLSVIILHAIGISIYCLTIHTHSITPIAVADVENQIQRKVKVLETSWT